MAAWSTQKNIEQHAYPPHAEDNGPLLPTTSGGLVCARCHKVITQPDFGVLRQSREVHKQAGCTPINVDRPAPSSPRDLSTNERRALLSVDAGTGKRLAEATVAPLLRLALIEEDRTPGIGVTARRTTPLGASIARLCEVATETPAPVLLFDLGPPDPRFAHLAKRRRA